MYDKKIAANTNLFFILLPIVYISCKGKNEVPSKEAIDAINLKKGTLISCGTSGKQFGTVEFETSCNEKVKDDFNLAIELLHSFEYDEAEKVFAKIIDAEPGCAMAYWGVAMCNYHPQWAPPSEAELIKGSKAIEIARSITNKSKREAAYIDAISSFYRDWDKLNHTTRCINFEKGMEKLYKEYPQDNEAAIFYTLALDAAADPTDKSFKNQRLAGSILTAMDEKYPNHPGIAHYIIHTYDYPELASMALPMARKYASIAPSSSHALHMPSHIFTRLGLWDECIQSNLIATLSARCYAEAAGIKGHWDEELHGIDYLVYAYLQKKENNLAKAQCDSVMNINEVYPVNFKVAYAFAAIPSRYLLENRIWDEAAKIKIHPANFPWKNFRWQEAIVHFTRLLGAVHTNAIDSAKAELTTLNSIYDTLTTQKDSYKATEVQIQIRTGEAWIQYKEGKNDQALALMNAAAAMEDKTEKHPVTPGEVLPARELLGDMQMLMNKPTEALKSYEADLEKHPNRFNGLYGAALAAQKGGNAAKASVYYKQLLAIVNPINLKKSALDAITLFLKNH